MIIKDSQNFFLKVTTTTAVYLTNTYNRLGNCDTDSFSITVPGGKSPPVICGVNTGELVNKPESRESSRVLNKPITDFS